MLFGQSFFLQLKGQLKIYKEMYILTRKSNQ